jgi:hypothetical protein
LHSAFGAVREVTLQVRSLDHWWASVAAYLVPRGEALPDAPGIEALVNGPRSWRHVVTDLACACPGTRIRVTPFECFSDRPDQLLRVMTGCPSLPVAHPSHYWANRRPDLASLRSALSQRGEDVPALPRRAPPERWSPFDDTQVARLRETYADDLAWLRAGADGLAILTEDPEQPDRAGPRPPLP